MRIAIFTEVFLPKIDGITNRLRNTLACLREAGHEVLVFAPDTALDACGGFRVVRIPSAPFPLYPGVRMSAPAPRILGELREFCPDVVHAVGPVLLGSWGIAAARLLALPIVASYHTDLPRYAPLHGLGWVEGLVWPWVRRIHQPAHVNLAPSRHTQRELQDHDIPNVGVWRGGVDTARFHPKKCCDQMRMRLSGGWPDAPLILHVGRVSAEKRVDQFADILDAIPDAQLAIVGDGPARQQLEASLPRDRVTFMGFLTGETLAAAFASADVFFTPSTTETLGFVVLEAMASRLPVVAADAGGIPDLVRNRETGFLFDPDEPSEAIDVLQMLLQRPSARDLYGGQARKFAQERSWALETDRLVDHYRRAIAISSQSSGLARWHRALVGRARSDLR